MQRCHAVDAALRQIRCVVAKKDLRRQRLCHTRQHMKMFVFARVISEMSSKRPQRVALPGDDAISSGIRPVRYSCGRICEATNINSDMMEHERAVVGSERERLSRPRYKTEGVMLPLAAS